MSHRSIALALGGVVLLLLGVVVGQNLERSRRPLPEATPQPASPAPAATSPTAGAPGQAAPAASPTQYWISPPEVDSTRRGFASWAVLRRGGNFVLDRCRAPDFALPSERGAPIPLPLPVCETLIDGVIQRMDEDSFVVPGIGGAPQTIRLTVVRGGAPERLILVFGERIELVPGSKNDLYQRLQRIPGDDVARTRYMERYFAGAGRPAQ